MAEQTPESKTAPHGTEFWFTDQDIIKDTESYFKPIITAELENKDLLEAVVQRQIERRLNALRDETQTGLSRQLQNLIRSAEEDLGKQALDEDLTIITGFNTTKFPDYFRNLRRAIASLGTTPFSQMPIRFGLRVDENFTFLNGLSMNDRSTLFPQEVRIDDSKGNPLTELGKTILLRYLGVFESHQSWSTPDVKGLFEQIKNGKNSSAARISFDVNGELEHLSLTVPTKIPDVSLGITYQSPRPFQTGSAETHTESFILKFGEKAMNSVLKSACYRTI